MTAICLWNWPLSKPGSFCKRRAEGGGTWMNYSEEPIFLPNWKFAGKENLQQGLWGLVKLTATPRTPCFTVGETEQVTILSCVSLTLKNWRLQGSIWRWELCRYTEATGHAPCGSSQLPSFFLLIQTRSCYPLWESCSSLANRSQKGASHALLACSRTN